MKLADSLDELAGCACISVGAGFAGGGPEGVGNWPGAIGEGLEDLERLTIGYCPLLVDVLGQHITGRFQSFGFLDERTKYGLVAPQRLKRTVEHLGAFGVKTLRNFLIAKQ